MWHGVGQGVMQGVGQGEAGWGIGWGSQHRSIVVLCVGVVGGACGGKW